MGSGISAWTQIAFQQGLACGKQLRKRTRNHGCFAITLGKTFADISKMHNSLAQVNLIHLAAVLAGPALKAAQVGFGTRIENRGTGLVPTLPALPRVQLR